MSATACNTCHELITFVLNANGRWRPVDVAYTAFELNGDELLAVQEDGQWRQMSGSTVRVYTAPSCPENPEWNKGRARTRLVSDGDVDKVTGEIGQRDHTRPHLPARGTFEWAVPSYQEHVLAVECPECHARPGAPCVSSKPYGGYLDHQHTARNLRVAFADPEPWPPKGNQKGYYSMRRWLSSNANLFDLLTEGAPTP